MVRQCFLQDVLRILRACFSLQLLKYNHQLELTKFEIILKHYWKQVYKAATTARRICEVEGEGVDSKRVAQIWFQRFNTEEGNTKDLPCSGRPQF